MHEAFVDLINSEHIHSATFIEDHLADAERVDTLLKSWGCTRPITPTHLNKLRSLRTLLQQAIAEFMTTETLSEQTLSALNHYMSKETRNFSLSMSEAGDVTLTKSHVKPLPPASFVALSFARFIAGPDNKRIKLCQNNHCRQAYIDTSKNRSKKWCSSSACGNLTKVRAFRARAKQKQG